MPALLTNNAEGGSNGTGVTIFNTSGTSGALFDYVSIGTNANITFSNTQARGNLSYKFSTGATSTTSYVIWAKQFPASATSYVRCYLYLTSISQSLRFIEFRDGTGVCMSVGVTTSGKISVRDNTQASMGTMTTAIPINKWVRVEIKCVAHATAGQVTAKLFMEADSPYPAETLTSAASFNTRPNGVDVIGFAFGLVGLGTTNDTIYIDDMAASDAGFLGPADPTQTASLLLANNAEMNSNGTAATASNTGDSINTFFTSVRPGSGTLEFSTLQAAHGTRSIRFVPDTSLENSLWWTTFSSTTAAMRLYVYFTGYPSVAMEFAQFNTQPESGAFTQLSRFILTPTHKLALMDNASTTLWTSTSDIPLNTWIRVEMYAAIGGTASTGTVNAAYYTLDSTTPTESFSTSSATLGTANIGHARFGKIVPSANITEFYFDELAVQQGASGFIGPYTGPPTAPATYPGIIPHLGWGRAI